ncbi:MAG: 30S ribosomal protein S4 [Nanoarchaeota archaeon]|nr:30S ribosomal protein S4 [Nanoarchaeota archaeon]MBU4300339.1 30S ribosomal protein S4 [Nanoarchaeota archaeon]MBU4452128.1 30S ribosomal protein S4 [Nanoarchaeota archaeon]MCG2724260.1 30S ribosomal protein S4 [archaeon]
MGDPKKMKKHYESPKRPWEKTRFEKERKIVTDYGIRRKKEIRRFETIIRDLRRRTRSLIATKDEKESKLIIEKVLKMGLLAKANPALEDILSIELNNILERRLQTLVVKKGFANTIKQSRQFITHGHITLNGQKIISPNYIVTIAEEAAIMFRPTSSLNSTFERAERREEREVREAQEKKAREIVDKKEVQLEEIADEEEIKEVKSETV